MTRTTDVFRGHRIRLLLIVAILVAASLLVLSCGSEDTGQAEASKAQAATAGAPGDNRDMAGSMKGTHSGDDMGNVPAGYEAGSSTVAEAGTIYGCGCCPDVRSTEPGKCPKCNMELVPIEPGPGEMTGESGRMEPGTGLREEWTCSMHPDVRSDEPGLCPECNMRLIPVEPETGEKPDDAHMTHPETGETMEESHTMAPRPGETMDDGHMMDPETGAAAAGEVEEWTCGMHPAIRSKQPGKCPICNMDLVPVTSSDRQALRLDEDALNLVGAHLAKADYLPLVRVVWAVGQVEYDERQVRYVPSRVPGRVEKLYADFVGTEVHKDQPLLDIYSPELITALGEYERARSVLGDGRQTKAGDVQGAGVEALAQSAKTRLRLWGLDDEEIDRIVAAGEATTYRIPIRSPISGTVIDKSAFEGKYVKEGENLFTVADLSKVWITADLYEDDLGSVRVGDLVEARSRTYPGEVFQGRVAFMDPYVNRSTRAARIRMELPNPEMRLRPGMYVEARLEVPVSRTKEVIWTCPMHPEVVSDEPGDCPECGMFLERIEAGRTLAVPEDAVVHTGETALAYVEKEPGTYEARRLVLGPTAALRGAEDETYYPVMEGLMPGETVITDAGFLVHSQARLTGQAASAYGGALDVDAGGHTHGH